MVRRLRPPCDVCPGPLASVAVGVGSSRTARPSGNPMSLEPPCRARILARRASHRSGVITSCTNVAVGVGSRPRQDEQPAALVGRADIGRAYTHPLRIPPEAGKVGEDGVESQGKVSAHVLKQCESGS
ncbi:hypothetical protein CFP65_3275 [Kitasatospora sp. MMS16-BH015]|nr:hypothetical protein CFP65_3275 [Kitasatospora sp. MMS16-BH015]